MAVTKQFNINMDGKTFIEWEDSKRKRLKMTRDQTTAVVCFGFSFLFAILAWGLIDTMFYVPPEGPGIFSVWAQSSATLSHASWSSIGKYLVALFSPVIVLAWLIHGVGFHIVK